jgi:hypothetical protein
MDEKEQSEVITTLQALLIASVVLNVCLGIALYIANQHV